MRGAYSSESARAERAHALGTGRKQSPSRGPKSGPKSGPKFSTRLTLTTLLPFAILLSAFLVEMERKWNGNQTIFEAKSDSFGPLCSLPVPSACALSARALSALYALCMRGGTYGVSRATRVAVWRFHGMFGFRLSRQTCRSSARDVVVARETPQASPRMHSAYSAESARAERAHALGTGKKQIPLPSSN